MRATIFKKDEDERPDGLTEEVVTVVGEVAAVIFLQFIDAGQHRRVQIVEGDVVFLHDGSGDGVEVDG